jgi:hypothetical protein
MSRRPGLMVILIVLICAACNASPFAPAPFVAPCGTEQEPCLFTCDLDCAATVVGIAAGCMQTLEGTLSGSRTRCDFPDGSQVLFARPLPAEGSDLGSRSWNLKVIRQGETCLALAAEPLPWVGGGLHARSAIELSQNTRFSQELWMTSTTSDGGPLVAERVVIHCIDDVVYEKRAEQGGVCADCTELDCQRLPLVEARASWSGAVLELQLVSGDTTTPLFSCR